MAGPPVEDGESSDLDSERTGNWRYVGGRPSAPSGWSPTAASRSASRRQSVVDAYGADAATGDPILVPGFRIGFDGTDQVTWLGDVQCGP
jgi:hypothetical protein